MGLTIGISKGSGAPKYANYRRWIEGGGDGIEVVDLSVSTDLDADVARLDGLVLTGGDDVDPERYGRPELRERCHEIDPARDAIELRMLELAAERELPVLGICRGLQVMNVQRGGTLVAHLPDLVPGSEAHQKDGDTDRRHAIEVMPGTLLLKASGDTTGEVNSAHHQAIDRLADGLMVAARSDDGVIEAIELANKLGAPYFVGVQWHPERMTDAESGLSRGIRDQFLFEAESSRILAGVRRPEPRPEPEPPTPPPSQAGGGEGDPLLPVLPIIQ